MNDPVTPPTPAAPKPGASRTQLLVLVLLGLALVGTYAAMFIPALAGQPVNPQTGPGALLWTSVFFYVYWKRRGGPGWRGAVLGAFIGLCVFILAAFVSGYVRHA